MTEDSLVRQRVIDELDFDPSIAAAGIGVSVSKGVVTLTGHVSSFFEQEAAIAAARRVRGVKAVAQELEVRLPGLVQRSDDEIASRAVSILRWTMHGENDIQAVVSRGWVTLSGHVEWEFQKRSAEQAVLKLGGVTGITNQISISPRISLADVEGRIIDAFRRSAELDGAGIAITVAGTTVTLSGSVKTWHERRLAEEAAWRAPGVTRVIDQLTVGP